METPRPPEVLVAAQRAEKVSAIVAPVELAGTVRVSVVRSFTEMPRVLVQLQLPQTPVVEVVAISVATHLGKAPNNGELRPRVIRVAVVAQVG